MDINKISKIIGTISRILLAIIGVVVGGFLFYAAYTSRLGYPEIDTTVAVVSFLLLIGCGAYLIIMAVRIFSR